MTEPSASARETRTLELLDTLVQQPAVRRELDAIADRLEARLAAERSEPLVWQSIEERPDEARVGTNQRHYVRQ